MLNDIEKSNFELEPDTPLFSNDLDGVYKKEVPINFKREWNFFIKGGDTVLPPYLDLDTEIILFPELEALYNTESRQVKDGLKIDTGTSLREIGQTVAAVKKEVEKGTPARKVAEETRIDADEFVKNITIRHENDSQISIQRTGKLREIVDLTGLGFREGGSKIQWNSFLEVLINPPHLWKASQNSERQHIRSVATKLSKWIQMKYNQNFPSGYKLYELLRDKAPGTYRFKFRIEYKDTSQTATSNNKKAFREKFFKIADENPRGKLALEMAGEGVEKGFLETVELEEIYSK